MAWSNVATIGAAETVFGSGPLSTPATDFSGSDLIVITLGGGIAPTGAEFSDSSGNTYELGPFAGDYGAAAILYCFSPVTSASQTFTFNPSGDWTGAFSVLGISGAQANGLDATNSATSSYNEPTSFQAGAIDPAVNNELIVAVLNINSTASGIGIDSPFTIEDAQGVYAENVAQLVQTTAASVNPTWSWTTANNCQAAIASFKPASGGGGTTLTASISETWGDLTASASATVGHAGSVAETLSDWAASAGATLGHLGSAAETLPPWAVAASAVAGHPGVINETIAPWGNASSAVAGHSASIAATWPAWVISASATLGSATVSGSIAATWGDFASSAQAVLGHVASVSRAISDWSASAVAALGHGASIDEVWPDWESSSAGRVLGTLLGASGVVGRLQAIGAVAKRQILGGIGRVDMARTNDLEPVSPDAGGTRYIDFGPVLQQLMSALGTTGLTLSAATVSCSVATGSNVQDPNAAALIPASPTLLTSPSNQAPSSAVFFDIAPGGVSGALYKVVCLGTRSDNTKQIELFSHFSCVAPY